jgi:broad specificity phosphatase PhoE
MCFKYGDDELQWGPDAELTLLGEEQARSVGSIWRKELQSCPPVPRPTLFYCSPLRRTAKTLGLTFQDVLDIDDSVMVREKLREKLDCHTPDQRMDMKVMRGEHPSWPIEEDASEEDKLWFRDQAETFEEYRARAGEVVEEIFSRTDRCKDASSMSLSLFLSVSPLQASPSQRTKASFRDYSVILVTQSASRR